MIDKEFLIEDLKTRKKLYSKLLQSKKEERDKIDGWSYGEGLYDGEIMMMEIFIDNSEDLIDRHEEEE